MPLLFQKGVFNVKIQATEPETKKAKKPKKEKSQKAKHVKDTPSEAPAKKKRIVAARTNKKPNLLDLGLVKRHNFMSRTEAALTRIYPLTSIGNHRYEVANQECAVSVILKLVLKTDQTNPMTMDWSTAL